MYSNLRTTKGTMKITIPIFRTLKDGNATKIKAISSILSDETVLSEDDQCDCYLGCDDNVNPTSPKQQHQQQNQQNQRSCPATTKIGVSFDTVQVREYNRVLGDWWDVVNGLAIGWNYIQYEPLPLQKVEDKPTEHTTKRNDRPLHNIRRLRSTSPRTKMAVFRYGKSGAGTTNVRNRSCRESSPCTSPSRSYKSYDKTPTTSSQRFEILHQYGFSSEELGKAELQRERNKFERYLMDSMPRHPYTADDQERE
jgi:hypothetical protein